MSDGLSATQFYRLSVSDHDPDFITGGTQDNGSMKFDGNFWRIIFGGMEWELSLVMRIHKKFG